MTVHRRVRPHLEVQSTDVKPTTGLIRGTTLRELDTQIRKAWNGTAWGDPSEYGRVLSVAPSGGGFASLGAALAVAASGDLVRIFPGDYTEAPVSIPAGVTVWGEGDWLVTTLRTNDNANDFITMGAGSELRGVTVVGPTGIGRAAIRVAHVSPIPSVLDRLIITSGYYGVNCNPVDDGSVQCQNVIAQYGAAGFEVFLRCVDHGSVVAQLCSAVVLPGGSHTAIAYLVSGADAEMSGDVLSVLALDDITGLCVDDSGVCRINASTFRHDGVAGGTAVLVGAAGAPFLRGSGCSIRGSWSQDIHVDTAAAFVSYRGGARRAYISYPAGTSFAGSITDSTAGDSGVLNVGENWVGTNQLPLVDYTTGRRSTGIVSGFAVTRHGPGSRELHVAAGVGYVISGGLITRVSYAGGSITVTASQALRYVWLTAAGALAEAGALPDLTANLLLCACATDANDVIALAANRIPLPQPDYSLWTYNTDVIGVKCVTGGISSKHAGVSLEIDITDCYFYTHYDQLHSTGAAHITFTSWYRNPAGGWTTTAGLTEVDDEQYDAAGLGLQNIPGGEYARHTIYVVVSDAGTEYHMVYGQRTWAAPATNANEDPVPPDFLRTEGALICAAVVLKSAGDIALLLDDRQFINRSVAGVTAAAVNDHHLLINLAAGDDHPQYQLEAEKGAALGYCGLTAGGLVDIADLPSATAGPPTVERGATTIGGATGKLAFEDHNHSILTAAPGAITPGNAQQIGAATSVSRADHQHACPAFGTAAGTFCEGNDARLTNGARDFLYAADEGVTSTTSATYQTKVTLTTGALTGTYRVAFYAGLSSGTPNRDMECRLYNVTDAVELDSNYVNASASGVYRLTTGFAYVAFTGAAKSFSIQWRSPAGATISIRRARIEFWRVS